MDEIAANWKTVADTLRDGLLVVDRNGNILAVNAATETLTGYKAEELIGKSCRVLNCTGCKTVGNTDLDEPWCKLFTVGKSRDKKCQITGKDKHIVQILKSATVLRDKLGAVVGAVETLTDMSEIERQHQEITSLRKIFMLDDGFHGILGKSEVMQKLFGLIDNVSMSDAPVMIHGQSGTGKEMVARAIHLSSHRRKNSFIKVNCAALNENLLESELFGHVKGAFTGADQLRIGRFEAAHNGTLFLDEIGDIPLSIQVKLLRVLEEKEIERVGDNTPIPVDVRVVTATNRDLDQLIAAGAFRKDFYFRINVFPLYCPTLAERREDLPIIVQHFISNNNSFSKDKKLNGVTAGAMEKLWRYPWPGNIRELRNAIDYAFVLCPQGEIDVQHLPPKIANSGEFPNTSGRRHTDVLGAKDQLIDALCRTGGNQSEAARLLGVSRVTVWKRIRKYGIDLERDLF
ncbi:MAG: sigma 54-interacting transcriptional regulator [Proteobacteria bacterium]|nr:sigma 54-interacting transcriptional regulator [Pseudomonadota bacterium]MBU1710286.1 sigma 54-interacting transcriptional regulator [Pseudomonadota bacterium]